MPNSNAKAILALDCATVTGWCILQDGKVLDSGFKSFKKRRGDSNGAMFLVFRSWVFQMLNGYDFEAIVYERAHHRGGAATEICVNLAGRVQEVAAERGIEYFCATTSELKKHATGNGSASKQMMIEAAQAKTQKNITDDNEADAICLAYWAHDQIGIK